MTAGTEGFCEEMTTTLKSFPSVVSDSSDSGESVVAGSAISPPVTAGVTAGETAETEVSVDSSADRVDD